MRLAIATAVVVALGSCLPSTGTFAVIDNQPRGETCAVSLTMCLVATTREGLNL